MVGLTPKAVSFTGVGDDIVAKWQLMGWSRRRRRLLGRSHSGPRLQRCLAWDHPTSNGDSEKELENCYELPQSFTLGMLDLYWIFEYELRTELCFDSRNIYCCIWHYE